MDLSSSSPSSPPPVELAHPSTDDQRTEMSLLRSLGTTVVVREPVTGLEPVLEKEVDFGVGHDKKKPTKRRDKSPDIVISLSSNQPPKQADVSGGGGGVNAVMEDTDGTDKDKGVEGRKQVEGGAGGGVGSGKTVSQKMKESCPKEVTTMHKSSSKADGASPTADSQITESGNQKTSTRGPETANAILQISKAIQKSKSTEMVPPIINTVERSSTPIIQVRNPLAPLAPIKMVISKNAVLATTFGDITGDSIILPPSPNKVLKRCQKKKNPKPVVPTTPKPSVQSMIKKLKSSLKKQNPIQDRPRRRICRTAAAIVDSETSSDNDESSVLMEEESTTNQPSLPKRQLRSGTTARSTTTPTPDVDTTAGRKAVKTARRPIRPRATFEEALSICKDKMPCKPENKYELAKPDSHVAPPKILIPKNNRARIIDTVSKWTPELIHGGFLQFNVEEFKPLSRDFWDAFRITPTGNGFIMNPHDPEKIKIAVQHIWRVDVHLFYTATSEGEEALRVLPALKTMTMGEIQGTLEKFFGGKKKEDRLNMFWHRLYQLDIDPERKGHGLMLPYINIYKYYDIEDSCERARFNMDKIDNPIRREMHKTRYGYEVENTGITDSMTYIGFSGSFFCSHVEDCDYASCNFNSGGDFKAWHVVAGFEYPRLVSHIKEAYKNIPTVGKNDVMTVYSSDCTLHHKRVLVSPRQLEIWDIPFKTVFQDPGDLMVLGSRSMHMGCNGNLNVAYAANTVFADYSIMCGQGIKQCDHPYRIPHVGTINPDDAFTTLKPKVKKGQKQNITYRYKYTAKTIGNLLVRSVRQLYKAAPEFINRAVTTMEKDLENNHNPITEIYDATTNREKGLQNELRDKSPSPVCDQPEIALIIPDEEEEKEEDEDNDNVTLTQQQGNVDIPSGMDDSHDILQNKEIQEQPANNDINVVIPPRPCVAAVIKQKNFKKKNLAPSTSASVTHPKQKRVSPSKPITKILSNPVIISSGPVKNKPASDAPSTTIVTIPQHTTSPPSSSVTSQPGLEQNTPAGDITTSSASPPPSSPQNSSEENAAGLKPEYNLKLWIKNAVPLTAKEQTQPVLIPHAECVKIYAKRAKKTVLKPDEVRYKCPKCPAMFALKPSCEKHIKDDDKHVLYGTCERPGCYNYTHASKGHVPHMKVHWNQEIAAKVHFDNDTKSFRPAQTSDPSFDQLLSELKAHCARLHEAEQEKKKKALQPENLKKKEAEKEGRPVASKTGAKRGRKRKQPQPEGTKSPEPKSKQAKVVSNDDADKTGNSAGDNNNETVIATEKTTIETDAGQQAASET